MYNVCKVVVVAFKRWSRGSNFMTLTGKIVLFWMGNCIWEVVTKKCYTNKLRILTSAVLLFPFQYGNIIQKCGL